MGPLPSLATPTDAGSRTAGECSYLPCVGDSCFCSCISQSAQGYTRHCDRWHSKRRLWTRKQIKNDWCEAFTLRKHEADSVRLPLSCIRFGTFSPSSHKKKIYLLTSFADSAIKNPNVFLRSLTCADGFSIRPLETENKNTLIIPTNAGGKSGVSSCLESLSCS